MSNIILSISDSDKHFSIAIQEYEKRLRKDLKIQNIKPTKHWTQSQIIAKDTQKVIEILEKKYSNRQKILLSKDWDIQETLAIKKQIWWKNNLFIIGGPYWFDEVSLGKYIDKKISFGKITLPHWLAKLTLLEQIYRIDMISKWRNYHY